MFTIQLRRHVLCLLAALSVMSSLPIASAAALNPQPLPPGHVIPRCIGYPCD
jgi:hypothetical protein